MKLARAIISFAVAVATCALTTGANAQDAGQELVEFINSIPIIKKIGSHAQFVNALVWWAVEVRAHEILAEREAA